MCSDCPAYNLCSKVIYFWLTSKIHIVGSQGLYLKLMLHLHFILQIRYVFFLFQNAWYFVYNSSHLISFPNRIQNGLASNFTSLTKVLYDFNKILENGRISGSPLQKLEINSFDDEQIWQQLELQNEPILEYFQNAVSETIEDEDLSLLPESEDQECEEEASELEVDSQENLETDEEEEQLSDVGGDVPKGGERPQRSGRSDPRTSPIFSDEDSDLDFDISKLEQQTKMQIKPPGKPREKSVVDDKFFKLSEMENFLEKIEKEEEKRPEDEEEEEDIDLFEDIDSDEDEGGLFGRQKIKVRF